MDYDDSGWGYARQYHHIWEKVWLISLTASEYKVFGVIYRESIGWQKLFTSLTDEAIGERCNLTRQKVNKVKNALIGYNILIADPAQGIALNLDPTTWNPPDKSNRADNFSATASVSKLETPQKAEKQKSTVSKLETPTVSKLETKSVPKLETLIQRKERKLKERPSADADGSNTSQSENDKMGTDTPKKPAKKSRKKESANFSEEQLEELRLAMNTEIPEMIAWRVVNTSRQKLLNEFWPAADRIAMKLDGKPLDMEGFVAYLRYVRNHCSWMFERRPRGDGTYWQPRGFEYLLTEDTYTEVRESARDNW